MLVQEKFKRKKSFSHTGILPSLSVPTGAVGGKKFDLQLDGKSNTMKLGDGKSTFVISDVIGISELSEIVLFFLDDAMVLELVKGYIYVPKEDGTVDVINAKNKITNMIDVGDKVIWKSKTDILEYCIPYVKHKFNLTIPNDVMNYTNNLMFYIKLSYYVKENCLFSISFPDIFYGLGVGKFKFEVKEAPMVEKKVVLQTEVKEEEEYVLKSDEYEDSISYKDKRYNDRYSNYDSDDYFYPDDDDVLPPNMHEVDIFSDYETEDDI